MSPSALWVALGVLTVLALAPGFTSAANVRTESATTIITTTSRPHTTDSQLVRQFVRNVLASQNVTLAQLQQAALDAHPTANTQYTLHDFLPGAAAAATKPPATSGDGQTAGRQSDLMKQIKMQFVLDCALLDEKNAAASDAVTVEPLRRPTTPMIPSEPPVVRVTTPLPSSTTPLRRPKLEYDDDDDSADDEEDDAPVAETVGEFFDSMYDAVDDSFEVNAAQVAAAAEPLYTTEPTFGTTRRLQHHPAGVFQPMQQPPTIVYTLPQSIPAGYYPQYDAAVDDEYNHRNKRTTLMPSYGYGSGGYPAYVKGPHHQFVTGNVADSDPHRNGYLSTNIQVTSAYSPAPTEQSVRRKGGRESSEEGDEYGFYDAVDLNGLNPAGDGGDDDDDDDDDGDESDGESNAESGSSSEEDDDGDDGSEGDDFPQRLNKINRRKDTKKRKSKPHPDVDDYSYEDDDSNETGVEKVNSPSSFFDSIFGNFFAPISWIWPSAPAASWSPFRMFSGDNTNAVKPSVNAQEKSTSSVIGANTAGKSSERRRPKQPSFDSAAENEWSATGNGIEDGPGVAAWFDPFQASAEFSESWYTTTTPMEPLQTSTASSEASGFWNWFGGGGSEEMTTTTTTTATPPTEALEIVPNDDASGWNFFGLFGTPSTTTTAATTTTTRRPFMSISNPLQNPAAWLGLLAQHMATRPSPTVDAETTPVAVKKRVSYANHQLWRLRPAGEDAVAFLEEYRRSADGGQVQWWRGPTVKGSTDIVVPPAAQADLRATLADEDIPYEVIMWDLAQAILYENPDQTRVERVEQVQRHGHPLTWHRYHRYADIVRYMEHMQRNHSDLVELLHIGRSFEGRPLTVVRVAADERVNPVWRGQQRRRAAKVQPKKAVFVEAGAHGREWIGPASATWMVQRLVERIGGNDTLGETLRMVDWYVMPVLNPDGYEYSHEYDRFWRKTRSKHAPKDGASLFAAAMNWIRKDPKAEPSANCVGTDPNRNWDFEWNRATEAEEESGDEPAFQSDCSEFYAGPRAFSEPETRALSTFLMENRKEIKIFISLHAYGQMISYPLSNKDSDSTHPPPTSPSEASVEDPQYDMAHVALEAMRSAMHKPARASAATSSTSAKNVVVTAAVAASFGAQKYTIDRNGEQMVDRRHAGRADAYAMKGGPHIRYAYTLDMRDTGSHGFLLPPSDIGAAAREAFELVRGMVDYM